MTPVYILPRTPGATDTTEWTAFCRSKEPFIVIDHHRFTKDYSAERRRAFCVTRYRRFSGRFPVEAGEHWFLTLAAAQAFAAELAASLSQGQNS